MIMRKKDEKLATASSTAAQGLHLRLSHLGDIRLRKMFGGHGVFEGETMFALVDREGRIFFKADETNVGTFEEAGSEKHFRMPYYRVLETVLEDEKALQEWAQSSIMVSRNAK